MYLNVFICLRWTESCYIYRYLPNRCYDSWSVCIGRNW